MFHEGQFDHTHCCYQETFSFRGCYSRSHQFILWQVKEDANYGIVEAGRQLFDRLLLIEQLLIMLWWVDITKTTYLRRCCHCFTKWSRMTRNLLPVCQQVKSIHCYAVQNFTTLETTIFISAMGMYSRFKVRVMDWYTLHTLPPSLCTYTLPPKWSFWKCIVL